MTIALSPARTRSIMTTWKSAVMASVVSKSVMWQASSSPEVQEWPACLHKRCNVSLAHDLVAVPEPAFGLAGQHPPRCPNMGGNRALHKTIHPPTQLR